MLVIGAQNSLVPTGGTGMCDLYFQSPLSAGSVCGSEWTGCLLKSEITLCSFICSAIVQLQY